MTLHELVQRDAEVYTHVGVQLLANAKIISVEQFRYGRGGKARGRNAIIEMNTSF